MKYKVSTRQNIGNSSGIISKISFAVSEDAAKNQAIEWDGVKPDDIVSVDLIPDSITPPCERRGQFITQPK